MTANTIWYPVAKMIVSMPESWEPSMKKTSRPLTAATSLLTIRDPVMILWGSSSFMTMGLFVGSHVACKPKSQGRNVDESVLVNIRARTVRGRSRLDRCKARVKKVRSTGTPPWPSRGDTQAPERVLKYTCCAWRLSSQAMSPGMKVDCWGANVLLLY